MFAQTTPTKQLRHSWATYNAKTMFQISNPNPYEYVCLHIILESSQGKYDFTSTTQQNIHIIGASPLTRMYLPLEV